MKKLIFYLILIFSFVSIKAQNYSIPELMFQPKNKLVKSFNKQQIKYRGYNQRLRDYHSEFHTDTFAINLIADIRFDRGGPEDEYRIVEYDSYLSYDILLNKYYNLLRAKLNKDDKEKLKQAQLIWLKFRDSESEFIDSYLSKGGGLGARAMIWTRTNCIKNHTEHLFNNTIELTKEEYENNY